VAWDRQQALDVHEVVHAEEYDGKYALMVNHPSLKASILKVFIPDANRPGEAYYYVECRAGFGDDQSQIWSACRTALDGMKFSTE
jgi:hypothetical protein